MTTEMLNMQFELLIDLNLVEKGGGFVLSGLSMNEVAENQLVQEDLPIQGLLRPCLLSIFLMKPRQGT